MTARKSNQTLRTLSALSATSAITLFGLAGQTLAQGNATGLFTKPLTGSNVILSVDMNGGPLASASATTEGSGGTSTVGADPYGVTWSAWGGPTYSGGDGTQLPSNEASPNVTATSITKAFGPATVTISEAGTASNYGTVNGVESLNSRDRGNPTGTASDNDMFRDLIFAGSAGTAIQSTNYLQVSFTGLAASTSYQVALFSYDSTGNHSMNWTATAPTANLSNSGHLGYNPDPTDIFTAPSDEQTIAWTAGTTPAPAVFTLTSSATGALTLYGFGGDGITGDQSASTSYLNGFQIATVPVAAPEPSPFAALGLGVFGLGILALRARKRSGLLS